MNKQAKLELSSQMSVMIDGMVVAIDKGKAKKRKMDDNLLATHAGLQADGACEILKKMKDGMSNFIYSETFFILKQIF